MIPLSPEMLRLILAARVVAYGDSIPKHEDMRELDLAAEAFALAVPWEDEPEEGAQPLESSIDKQRSPDEVWVSQTGWEVDWSSTGAYRDPQQKCTPYVRKDLAVKMTIKSGETFCGLDVVIDPTIGPNEIHLRRYSDLLNKVIVIDKIPEPDPLSGTPDGLVG